MNEIKSELDNMVRKNLRISGQQIDLKELFKRVCKKNTISLAEFCFGSPSNEIIRQGGLFYGLVFVSWDIPVRTLPSIVVLFILAQHDFIRQERSLMWMGQ
jgi:hypothetical protein